MKKHLLFAVTALLLLSCSSDKDALTGDIWRGTLLTKSSAGIPFNFRFTGADTALLMEIYTGDHVYKVDEIEVTDDSVFIEMPLFGSSFRLARSEGKLAGEFIRSSYTMPFEAQKGVAGRFDSLHISSGKAHGRWLVIIGEKRLIGEFNESDSMITGSFLTPTGDYRYFEGVLDKEGTIMMSSFDGGFVRFFTATTDGENLRKLKMYSGFDGEETGWGFRADSLELPDAYSVTGMKKGYKSLGFSFPNLNGEMVSLSDQKFKDKVTIVQISGSWCPNCLDESEYLSAVYEKYSPGLEVIALAFERADSFEEAKKAAGKLASVAGIPYDVLVTSQTPAKVGEALPELENFKAFPTTIIIDKKGAVRKIHSGFSGPGTGVHFQKYKIEFEKFLDELIAE